jgi:ABC-type glycerol-3-phosphate transport system permease component
MRSPAARAKRFAKASGHAGVLVFFVTFLAFPFYWMLMTTFKTTIDLHDVTKNPFLFNEPPTLEHLKVLFEDTQYLQWLINTGAVGLAVVAITLVLAVPAGYALARMTGAWAQTLGIAIFLTYLVPPTILFIPFSRIIATLGLQDSLWSLVLVYPSFTVPFCTWLLMGFFKAIPRDLEDAAMIDGLSRFGAFVKVVMSHAQGRLISRCPHGGRRHTSQADGSNPSTNFMAPVIGKLSRAIRCSSWAAPNPARFKGSPCCGAITSNSLHASMKGMHA